MKKKFNILALMLFLIPIKAQAFIPGLAELVPYLLGYMKKKEDGRISRIEKIKKLRKVLGRIKKTSQDIEEMHAYGSGVLRKGEKIRRMWKKAHKGKIVGAIAEELTGINYNIGYYMPQTPLTAKLKKKLNCDMSYEKATVREFSTPLYGTKKWLLKAGLKNAAKNITEKDLRTSEEVHELILNDLDDRERSQININKGKIKEKSDELKGLKKHLEKMDNDDPSYFTLKLLVHQLEKNINDLHKEEIQLTRKWIKNTLNEEEKEKEMEVLRKQFLKEFKS